jgi:hypothetical protein
MMGWRKEKGRIMKEKWTRYELLYRNIHETPVNYRCLCSSRAATKELALADFKAKLAEKNQRDKYLRAFIDIPGDDDIRYQLVECRVETIGDGFKA